MRQGQQNRRGRGRGGRKPQNPLARNFESNGPDVKIRGTAAHIAEKYMSLARDAMASGDLVTAESYLQHAEHYNRIIMAAQAQSAAQGNPQGDAANGGGGYRPRWNPDADEDGSDFDSMDASGGGGGGDTRPNHADTRPNHADTRPSQADTRPSHADARPNSGQDRGRGRHHHGGNGSESVRDANGEPNEANTSDESASDPVS
ncbi:MAG: DUF4167 domain-containing protein [Methyloceanibacter sp.]